LRRFWLIVGVAVVVVSILLLTPYFNRVVHHPSTGLAIAGALTGKMTQLSNFRDFNSGCFTSTVQGKKQWNGGFVGVVGTDHLVLLIMVTPYTGPGKYADPPVTDTRTLYQGTGIRPRVGTPVHVVLGTIPPTAPKATEYGSNPNPAYARTSQLNAGHQAPVGQVSLTLNADQKSGEITAVLMNARAIAAAPVTVSGSFDCGTLDSR
jgi:hypothetical protein